MVQPGKKDTLCRIHVFYRTAKISQEWETSGHLATLPLVSPRNDVWEMSAEIPYWWRVTTQIWVKLPIGWSKIPIAAQPIIALTRSGWWHAISMEFLRSFLRRHFAGKPVVALPNVGCFLRLKTHAKLWCISLTCLRILVVSSTPVYLSWVWTFSWSNLPGIICSFGRMHL